MLNKRGFSVQFFQTLEGLSKALAERRVAIIVLGDEGPSNVVEKNLAQLMSIPEVQGTRLVLSVSRYDEYLSMLAACSSFRDLIPIDLDEKHWVSRFIFATARSPIPMQEPHPQLSFNHMAALSLPARLVWVSEKRMLIEAKLRPEPGTSLHLSGAFVKALGLQKLSIVIEESRRTDLIYRFSDAVVARWSVPQNCREAAAKLLSQMRQTDFGPRCKVFLAIQDKDLRARIVKDLDPLRFEVNVALQKQSIVDEPKFFSPQIVFIEDKLCAPTELERIRQMMDNLSAEVPVYVIGNRVQIRKLQSLDPLRKINQLNKLPERLTDAIFTKYLPPNSRKSLHADEDAVNITPDHSFSFAEVTVSSRLLQLHARAAKLAVPVHIDSFGLCKVDSPIVSRFTGVRPYAKILESYGNPKIDAGNFHHIVETYICDLPQELRQRLAIGLAGLSQEILSENPYAQVDESLQAVANAKAYAPHLMAKMEAGYEPPLFAQDQSIPTKGTEEQVTEILQDVADAVDGFFDTLIDMIRSKGLRQFLVFVGLTSFLMTVIYFSVTLIAPKWTKSGGQYTDSLRNFAPQKFEERQRNLELQEQDFSREQD
jgi:hypothetical protein